MPQKYMPVKENQRQKVGGRNWLINNAYMEEKYFTFFLRSVLLQNDFLIDNLLTLIKQLISLHIPILWTGGNDE